MDEKKLTDKEIVKGLEYHLSKTHPTLLFDYKGVYVSEYAILDLINRQKAEIERLTGKCENQKAVIKGQNKAIEKEKSENKRLYDEYVRLGDFCADKGCICCICENKKTCNECKTCGSLKTEKCNSFKIDVSKYARAVERADKLQKQVDELTSSREIQINELHEQHAIVAEEIKQQAVTDTAKELLQELYNETMRCGIPAVYCTLTPKEIKDRAKRYGVEVE